MRSRVLSRGSIHPPTNICPRKLTMIYPWKGSRYKGCMAFKIIPCYKLKAKRIIVKNQNSKKNNLCQRKHAEIKNQQIKRIAQRGYYPSVSLKQVYYSQKNILWMEEPIPNSQSRRTNQGRLKRQMSLK